MVLPEHVGLQYDELIPQVVWRGTAFSYLSHMQGFHRPNFDKDVASQIDKQLAVDGKAKVAATHAMQKIYDDLGDNDKAEVYYLKCLDSRVIIKNQEDIAQSYSNLRYFYFKLGKFYHY